MQLFSTAGEQDEWEKGARNVSGRETWCQKDVLSHTEASEHYPPAAGIWRRFRQLGNPICVVQTHAWSGMQDQDTGEKTAKCY